MLLPRYSKKAGGTRVPDEGAAVVLRCHFVTVDQVFTDGLNDAAWLDRYAAGRTLIPDRANFDPF